jgi:hypothetical protein
LGEEIRFPIESIDSLSTKPGSGNDGLWQTIKLWNLFLSKRLLQQQCVYMTTVKEFLVSHKCISDDELPEYVFWGVYNHCVFEFLFFLLFLRAHKISPLFSIPLFLHGI